MTDGELRAYLHGSLTAASFGRFSDKELTEVVASWMALVNHIKGVSEETMHWSGRIFKETFEMLAAHPAPLPQKVVAQLRRLFHEGQWQPRT